MRLTEMPAICTLANIAVWELAQQTGSQTSDAGMPTQPSNMNLHDAP